MIYIDKKICEEKDNNGNNITIWYGDQLANSKAMPLFLKTYAELLEKEFTTLYHIPWNDSNRFNVVYCTDDHDNVLGGIAYEYRALIQQGWIILNFTNPDYRGKRINGIVHKYFENAIRERGGHQIACQVNISNQSSLKAIERTGMKPQLYSMHKWIDNI